MSTALMGRCWPLQMPPTAKAVLMSLADQGNDQGVCWPAVGTICDRTCLSTRAVQNAIKWLAANGVLVLNREQGKATTYQINPDAFGKATPDLFTAPARRAPPQQVHPRSGDGTPPHVVHPTPAAGAGDPRTSCTQNRKEPSVEPKTKRLPPPPTVAVALLIEAGFTPKQAADFIDHKARMKAPLTERAWTDHLREAKKAGWTPADAAEKVMAKTWKGFEAKYVVDERAPAPAATTSAPAEIEATQALLAEQEKHGREAQTPEAHAARKAMLAKLGRDRAKEPA